MKAVDKANIAKTVGNYLMAQMIGRTFTTNVDRFRTREEAEKMHLKLRHSLPRHEFSRIEKTSSLYTAHGYPWQVRTMRKRW
ncbi:hypothetical protein LCGC14_1437080 [marine sediment metagenome]|uniref:Uncharacterized protein n=1 Tax=marine sediment metagenome TaxID=412755 RepID=A0A0F9JMG0_9ZZZZ